MPSLADRKLTDEAEGMVAHLGSRPPDVVLRAVGMIRRLLGEARRLARFADFVTRVAFGEGDYTGASDAQALDAIRDALAGGGAAEGPEPARGLDPREEFLPTSAWEFAGFIGPADRGRRDLVCICRRCTPPMHARVWIEQRPPGAEPVRVQHVLLERLPVVVPAGGRMPDAFVGRCGRCGQCYFA